MRVDLGYWYVGGKENVLEGENVIA